MSIRFRALVCSSVVLFATAALAQTQTPSPQGAAVYFINLKDGDTVTSPFKVQFGGGQTETTVTLPPGSHTLQLVLGDWSHIPHNPPVMSPVITVTVK